MASCLLPLSASRVAAHPILTRREGGSPATQCIMAMLQHPQTAAAMWKSLSQLKAMGSCLLPLSTSRAAVLSALSSGNGGTQMLQHLLISVHTKAMWLSPLAAGCSPSRALLQMKCMVGSLSGRLPTSCINSICWICIRHRPPPASQTSWWLISPCPLIFISKHGMSLYRCQ